MFNTTQIKLGSNSQTVSFNTPSTGMMQKSNPKSKFIRFQKGSKMEEWLFPKENIDPTIQVKNQYGVYNSTGKVTVLQVLIFGDNQFLCEVVYDVDLVEIDECFNCKITCERCK